MISDSASRNLLFEKAISNKGYLSEQVQVVMSSKRGCYTEVIKESELIGVNENLVPLTVIRQIVESKISPMLQKEGYEVDESEIDYESSDLYDGYELNVPFKKIRESFVEEDFFAELDQVVGRQPMVKEKSTLGGKEKPEHPGARSSIGGKLKPLANTSGHGTPLNQEPGSDTVSHLPNQAKKEKTQNPKKVDLLLKSVFDANFLDYGLETDMGTWKPNKSTKQDGKLMLIWEHSDVNQIKIETLIFPNDSNKIKIQVMQDRQVAIDYFFEVYRIPTDSFLVEKFFRKTFFNLLKKFIETRVIQLEPFNLDYIFWKTDNPFFSYSFSSPKKNKIVKDLIAFISTAKKPILDDFFEQNNLKHKQGYLQTLLDSAEAAGIFKFAREGNEIVILKGANYKAFLDGKIRRVAS